MRKFRTGISGRNLSKGSGNGNHCESQNGNLPHICTQQIDPPTSTHKLTDVPHSNLIHKVSPSIHLGPAATEHSQLHTQLFTVHFTGAYLFSKSVKILDGFPISSKPGLSPMKWSMPMVSSRAVKLYSIAPLGSTLQRGRGKL